jgi:hypothetical protein
MAIGHSEASEIAEFETIARDHSAVDPIATIGSINDVELIWIGRQLRSLVQKAFDDLKSLPISSCLLRNCQVADSQMMLGL